MSKLLSGETLSTEELMQLQREIETISTVSIISRVVLRNNGEAPHLKMTLEQSLKSMTMKLRIG